jgi:hypothetical protein
VRLPVEDGVGGGVGAQQRRPENYAARSGGLCICCCVCGLHVLAQVLHGAQRWARHADLERLGTRHQLREGGELGSGVE